MIISFLEGVFEGMKILSSAKCVMALLYYGELCRSAVNNATGAKTYRGTLFMAAMSTIRYDANFRAFFERLAANFNFFSLNCTIATSTLSFVQY